MLFPRRSKKPKQGDSSAEELAAVDQAKGPLMPIVHDKYTLEKVTLTDELKVSGSGVFSFCIHPKPYNPRFRTLCTPLEEVGDPQGRAQVGLQRFVRPAFVKS